MAVSRRIFLWSSVVTALGCAASPLKALAGGRVLPGDTDLPRRNTDQQTTVSPGPLSHGPIQRNQTPEQKYDAMSHLTRDAFQGAIGSAFKVSSVSGTIPAFWLTLLAVKDLSAPVAVNPAAMAVSPPAASQSVKTTMFNLLFSGGPVESLHQDTFFFQHAELGQFALFIVPAGPQQYTAAINRLNVETVIPV